MQRSARFRNAPTW